MVHYCLSELGIVLFIACEYCVYILGLFVRNVAEGFFEFYYSKVDSLQNVFLCREMAYGMS